MTWAISVPILVFLGLSVLELRLMYATDRRLMPTPNRGGGIISVEFWGHLLPYRPRQCHTFLAVERGLIASRLYALQYASLYTQATCA